MKQFSLSQDAAYLVPALRSRGSSFAWPTTWRHKAGVLFAVIAAHVALLWMALWMVAAAPPEALPMAETEVILEQISADSPVSMPAPQQVKLQERVSSPVPAVALSQQKTMREAEMTETVKPVVAIKPTPMFDRAKPEPTPTAQEAPAASTAVKSVASAPTPVAEAAAKPSNNAKGAGVAFNPKPPYPKALEEAGVGGTVGLSIQVNAEGRASSVSVVRSSGQPALDASARDTVLNRWKFKPARAASGDAVASTLVQSIRFVPND
ncbi:hypothetical protein DTO96_100680 [Ephemeroptericola cinctiostellae]|uniref:TonB C-terminal domain-containing protein n=1 Tax=Ephemeroptericola cinctiostellae TaxID=2268024 RepID=A0A345D9C5_9BURK|nr:energy transducer TonB [Ephemeroptericola cinctiostellae]AXF84963.1 hypothetical protein DTO96_100680 [Ephemeroptericola cinctiostellae]